MTRQPWTEQEMDIVGDENKTVAECCELLPNRTRNQVASKRRDMARRHRDRTGMPPAVRYWTSEEIDTAMDRSRSVKEIAAALGRKPDDVRAKRSSVKKGLTDPKWNKWTKEEDDVVSNSGLKAKEIGLILGRNTPAVQQRKQVLRRRAKGEGVDSPAHSVNPFFLNSRSILLAKTCVNCGKLMDVRWFKRAGSCSYAPGCTACRRGEAKDYKASVEEKKKSQDKFNARMRELTTPAARGGYEYTSKDHEILSAPEKTVLEKAIETQRSYAAVKIAVSRFSYTSRTHYLGDQATGVWNIEFPERKTA